MSLTLLLGGEERIACKNNSTHFYFIFTRNPFFPVKQQYDEHESDIDAGWRLRKAIRGLGHCHFWSVPDWPRAGLSALFLGIVPRTGLLYFVYGPEPVGPGPRPFILL